MASTPTLVPFYGGLDACRQLAEIHLRPEEPMVIDKGFNLVLVHESILTAFAPLVHDHLHELITNG